MPRTFVMSLIATLASAHLAIATPQPAKSGVWTPVPLISAEMRTGGVTVGGEGGQWVRTIAIDSLDGKFLLYGTDVGGIFRSLDGGNTWEPANVGFRPRGSSGSAIDPHNPDRVLVVGANSVSSDFHGLWLSINRAASWKHVQLATDSGTDDIRDQLAYDPSSYDAARKFTTDVYWSRVAIDKPKWGETKPQPSLYKSADGGETWARLPNTEHLGGGIVRVHPTARGVVYIATPKALYRSDDAATTFKHLLAADITGMDVSRAAPDQLILTTKDSILISKDRGQTTTALDVSSIKESGFTIRGVRLSPATADRVFLWQQQDEGWDWRRYTSADAGKTWTQSTFDNRNAFLPYNVRNGLFAPHPTNPDTLVSTGADWPTRSDDGGKTYRWSAGGFNAVLVGGSFHFSVSNPEVIGFGSQDYNGAVSDDAGYTFRYINPSGNGWGGFTYAGYAVNNNLIVIGNAAGWGAAKSLRLSTDGGKTWVDRPDVTFSTNPEDVSRAPLGVESSLSDASDPDRIIYFGPLRSADAGQTWSRMSDCSGVIHSGKDATGPYTLGLHLDQAARQSRVVESRDGGNTWKTLATVPGLAADAAVDHASGRGYVVSGELLRAIDLKTGAVTVIETPTDDWGGRRVRSVCLDPIDPNIVYAAQNRDVFTVSNGVLLSRDAGKTWVTLNVNTALTPGVIDGGREPQWVRVHPTTRDLWVATGCMGIWKINVVSK